MKLRRMDDGGGLGAPTFPDDFELHDAVGDPLEPCSVCLDLHDAIHSWGARDGSAADREIVISLRTNSDDEATHAADVLPVDAAEHDEFLEDIQTFAYRFCRCVDYIQSGNESFAGNGVFGFDINGVPTPINQLPASAVPQATADVLEWLAEQRAAALRGSALGGRPLRLFGPGLIRTTVHNASYGGSGGGYGDPDGTLTGANRSAYFIREVLDSVNAEDNTYADMHLYYEEPAGEDAGYDTALDGFFGASAPWDAPNRIGSLECAPKTSEGWYDQNKDDLKEYRLIEDLNLPPGLPAFYNTYVEDVWRDAEHDPTGITPPATFGFNGDFDFDGCLSEMQSRGFALVCYGIAFQFGDGTDLEEGPREFDCSALTGNFMDAQWFESADQPGKRTLMLKDVLLPAADLYDWEPFELRGVACDPEDTCPGCEP